MIYTRDGILWENPNCVWSINSHFRIWKSYENILYQKSYWKGSKSEFLWGHKSRRTADFYVLLHIFAVGPSVVRVIKHRFNASWPRPFLGQLDSAMKFSGAVVWLSYWFMKMVFATASLWWKDRRIWMSKTCLFINPGKGKSAPISCILVHF